MVEFLQEYGLFLAKSLTWLAVILVILAAVARVPRRGGGESGHIEVTPLNALLDERSQAVREAVLPPQALKCRRKQREREEKARSKALAQRLKAGGDPEEAERKRIFVLDFDGDIKASAVENLRQEITSVLGLATAADEVLLRLESGGGLVHSYGLAASQLQRLRDCGVPLVVAVDRVAASGGYMMACIADRILAAPFALLGSIGVVAQIPNFHRLLKKHDVDFELLTAGQYKRTLTLFGENTAKGRQKFVDDLEDTHQLFKTFVAEHRPQLDLQQVGTGEVWFGRRALEASLVDEIGTSDQYLLDASQEADLYQVRFVEKKSLPQRLGISLASALERVLLSLGHADGKTRFFS